MAHELLVALVGGPAAGKVVSASSDETEIQMVTTTIYGVRTHIYRVREVTEEPMEAFYEMTFNGLPAR